MMGFNPERMQEAMVILNKYKDPTTNYLDANNPDYLAEIAALNQKYAPAQTQTQQAPVQTQQAPAQTQTQQAPAQTTATSDSETPKNMAYLTSTTGAKTFGGGKKKVYMTDENTGQQYVYDHEPGDYKGWRSGIAPPEGANLKVGTVLSKTGSEGDWTSSNPTDLYFGGRTDPETKTKYLEEARKDDKSDNDIYYTAPNGKTYVDVTGTGQGIPVGSTNITRSHSIDFDSDPETWKEPVLSKGFSGYYDQSNSNEVAKFEGDQNPEPKDLTFGNVFSLTPGGAVIDTGLKNPFTGNPITMSNPPSQLQNLEPFFNQAESFGYENYKKQFDDKPSYLENLLGVQPVPKSVGEMIQETGGSNIFPDQGDSGGGSGGGGGDDDDNGGGGGGGGGDDSTTPPKFAFAPPMKSAPISTAPDEPINTDPRFQPIFPQQPIQPIGPIEGGPVEKLFPIPTQPQASPAMPQPQPIPMEAQPAVMPPSFMDPAQSVPSVIPPETFADVMHRGGAKGQPGINPYFQDIEQINRSAPYSPIIGMAGGGGIMSLQNRMLMDPASRAMSQGIMS
jgi:hypothetical protein